MAPGDPLHGAQTGPLTTFLLIHGKWHEGSSWALLAPLLRERGHLVVAPDLPFEDGRATYGDRIEPALDAVADVAEPVVVVGHSLGVAYAPLVAAARPVSLIVYLCPAPTGPFGGSAPMRKTRPGFPFPPDAPDGTSVWDPDAAIAAMYPRLEPETARAAAAKLRPGASPRDDYPLASQPEAPAAVIYATEDEFFEPEWERWAARELIGVEPIEIPGGHFPMLAAPEMLAELLQRLAVGSREQAAP